MPRSPRLLALTILAWPLYAAGVVAAGVVAAARWCRAAFVLGYEGRDHAG